MKLTNISLAILVALGLAACGGSDDNNDQTTDPKTPPKKEEPKKEVTPTKDEEPKGDSALDPKRAAPDLTVPEDVKSIVAANKRVFINRGFSNPALGYDSQDGYKYDKKEGTDPENVKMTSVYNYSDEDDVIPSKISGYDDKSVGAIFVAPFDQLTSPTDHMKLNAFVKTKAGYVRVGVNTAVVDSAEKYTPETKFHPVKAGAIDPTVEYDQSEVVFIANAVTTESGVGEVGSEIELGKYKNATDKAQFKASADQVMLNNVKVFGKEYNASVTGQNLDFNGLDPMREIQTEKVTGSYSILNFKGNADSNDDKTITESITLGNVKAYNLPYSIALVTTNVDEKKPAPKDIFNMGDAFQVFGFKTVALPQNGRTFYKGKSFSANTTGDVTLYADFFEDRAGLEGVIDNRKDNKGGELAALTLNRISLVESGQKYKTTGVGSVSGSPSYADTWDVQLFGPEAEEAAGKLYAGGKGDLKANPKAKVVEVYNTQRDKLTNQSNTADTK